MNIYIDIDGVLLTKQQKIPKGAQNFISYLTTNFSCYWLTTHCRTGSNKTLAYLKQFYGEEILQQLSKIQVTNWVDLKTEGIDFREDFIWLEDYPFEAEKKILQENGKLDALFLIDLKDENALDEIVEKISSKYLS